LEKRITNSKKKGGSMNSVPEIRREKIFIPPEMKFRWEGLLGCRVAFWIILDGNDQRILLMVTGRVIIFLVGSVPIVFTGDIRF
jgi:hypothetical protein